MANEEHLYAASGRVIRSLHVAKHDADKDDQWWADFAMQMARREAELIGLADAFDRAYAARDRLHLQQIAHNVTLHKLMKESKSESQMRFWLGVVTGVVAAILWRAYVE